MAFIQDNLIQKTSGHGSLSHTYNREVVRYLTATAVPMSPTKEVRV